MMSEMEVRADIQKLGERLGQVETELRVVKHDMANVMMQSQSFDRKLEKFEDRIGGKIDGLAEKIAALNVKQERGFGFFAGISFVLISVGAVVIGAVKLLTGG